MAENKMNYGTVDQLPENIERRDVTVHISMKIEADLLDAIRERAKKESLPYQTLMKQMLRRELEFSGNGRNGLDLGERMAAVEKHLRKLVENRSEPTGTARKKASAQMTRRAKSKKRAG